MIEFDVQVAHSVEEIGRDDWDRLSTGRPFASYRWHRYGEAVLADNTPLYIVLSQGGEPQARATFWLRKQEALAISSPLLRKLVEAFLRRWPLLICKAPLADASGLILPDPPLREAALKTILQVAESQAEAFKASLIACDWLKQSDVQFTGWPSTYAATEVPEPGTHLAIGWPDFESYLQWLSTKTRASYRLNCNRAEDLEIDVSLHPMTQPLDEATLDQTMILIRNVERHHGAAHFPWARAMMEHAGLVEAVWVKATIGQRLVCCCILLRDGDAMMMKLLGRDYDVRYAYFVLVYSGIRWAIEEGVKVVWGGSGSYDLKQRLGFQLEKNNYIVYSGRGPVLQKLVSWLGTGES